MFLPAQTIALLVMLSACEAPEGATSLAPISTGGSLETLLLTRKDSTGQAESAAQVIANMSLGSFIWQPWLAQMRGDFSVAYDQRFGDRDNGAAMLGSGAVTLAVLPRSPFPATLNVAHTDSRVTGDFTGSDYIHDRANLSARAAFTPDLRGGLNLAYDRIDVDRRGLGTSALASMSLSQTLDRDNTFLGTSSVGFGAGLRTSDFLADDPLEDDTSLLEGTLAINALSEPARDVIVNSSITGFIDDITEGERRRDRMTFQALSNAQWRPEDVPYTVTGTFRALFENLDETRTGTTTGNRTILVSGTGGVLYPINDRLSTNAGFRLGYEDNARDIGSDPGIVDVRPGQRYRASVVAGMDYISETYDVGGFDWRYDGSAQTDTGFDTEEAFSARGVFRIGHEFSKDLADVMVVPARFIFRQTAESDVDSEDIYEVNARLTNTATLNYASTGRASNSFGYFFIRDSRDIAGKTDEFQTVQLRLGHNRAISEFQRIQANLTTQFAREVDEFDSERFFLTLSTEVNYDYREVFGVRNLDFNSILRINIVNAEEFLGEVDPSFVDPDNLRNDWRNILRYRIGRLVAEAEASGFHDDGGVGYLVLFRLRREFSGVF